MYKLRLLFGMALLIISILIISCGSSVIEEVPADEDQISAPDEDGEDHEEGDAEQLRALLQNAHQVGTIRAVGEADAE